MNRFRGLLIVLVIITVAAIISLIITSIWDLKPIEEYHREANALEQEKKYKEAIELLDKAIKKDPTDITLLLDRAVDKSAVNDFKGAIADNTEVINLDTNNGLAFLNRGKNKKRLEDYIGAIEDFNKAISTKGGELIYIDKVENQLFNTGFEFDVTMEEIRFERGIAYYEVDSLERAFDDFNFSIQKDFCVPRCYYFRGLIYVSYDLKEKGCKDLLKAQELGDPYAGNMISKYCQK